MSDANDHLEHHRRQLRLDASLYGFAVIDVDNGGARIDPMNLDAVRSHWGDNAERLQQLRQLGRDLLRS